MYAINPASSSGSAYPSGEVTLANSFKLTPSGIENPAIIGVFMPPGATALTRTPRFTYSTESARVRFTTPPFDAQYAAEYGWPMRPAFDATLTIEPPPSRR